MNRNKIAGIMQWLKVSLNRWKLNAFTEIILQLVKKAEIAIFICIEGWYNKKIFHTALGNKQIIDFNNQNKNQNLVVYL